MLVEVLLILILISLSFGFYHIVKQQGRIILRLDRLEQQLAVSAQPAAPAGLATGELFPSFRLPDLEGREVALEEFRGRRVLLVHWRPQCGFCDLIAPDLARLESVFQKRNLQTLLLAYGDAESNRKLAAEHGLRCPILLLKDAEPPEPFQRLGTPAAYLLDEQGRVSKPLAEGSDEVSLLAQEAAGGDKRRRLPGERPLSQSRIERNGLKAGTPAPLFRLPDIDGRTVALQEYRGRRVLLVFSDPHCGPCDELAPHLARLHQEHSKNGLAMVMISRGDGEANRQKAEQHGIQFPVLLQERWKLSKEYGTFATPVAFLLREDGVIAKNVAIGPDAILALAREGMNP
ncbi:MAG: TlpA family protein disulfide reductase [Acidobacteria bacterium]|nr:TlpA family protein disulfide reductase [Acidobacteriota bacterium]